MTRQTSLLTAVADAQAAVLRSEADAEQARVERDDAILAAREAGYSWPEIAQAGGLSVRTTQLAAQRKQLRG